MNTENKYIKVNNLKNGYTYKIKARNSDYGVWNERKGEFVISRFKFYDNYTFGEIHWDLSDHFGTVKPLEELEKCPYDVENYEEKSMLTYLNEFDTIKCSECGRGKNEWIRHEDWCKKRKEV